MTDEQSPVSQGKVPFRREGLARVPWAGMEVALGIEQDLTRRLAARATVTEHMPALGDRADVGFSVQLRYHPQQQWTASAQTVELFRGEE